MQLVAATLSLETVAAVMRPVDRHSNSFTVRKLERNDFTMLHNSQQEDVPSDEGKKSSKVSPKYNEDFGKLSPLRLLQENITKQKLRPRRNLNAPSLNLLQSLINDSINLPSTAPSTSTTTAQIPLDPIKDINVTCDMDHLSCKNRCAKERDLGQTNNSYFLCYCDHYCEVFTDCCFDYRQQCNNNSGYTYPNTSWLSGIETPKISKNVSTSDNYFKCISSKGSDLLGTNGIWMIADCPDNFQNTTAQAKCVAESSLSYQNHKDNIPVVSRNGKTYRNRFCSRCHGVSDDELSYYALSYSCRILPPRNYNKVDTLAFLSSHCSVSWKPNSGHQRRYCYSNIIKKCSRAAPEILRKSCHNGPPGIVTNHKGSSVDGYRNVYCAICFSVTMLECGPQKKLHCKTSGTCGSTLPFSVLMDIGFPAQSNSPNIPHQTHVSCPTGKVYDPHLELCLTGIASTPKQTGFDKYSVSVWILRKTTNPFETAMATSQRQLFSFQAFIRALGGLSISNSKITLEDKTYRVMFDFVRKAKKTRNQPQLATSLTADDLLEFTQPIEVLINSTNFTIIKVTSRRLTCVVVERFLPHEYTTIALPEMTAFINRTKEAIKRHDYYLSHSRNSSDGTITVCREHLHLSCINGTFVKLSSNEVTEFPNKSVLWNVAGKVYAEGNYEEQNGTIWICTNFSANGTKELLVEQVVEQSFTIITIVGLSLSVCSLSALLITYSIFCELRTLPGISLMNLSFCILASHLLWLVGSGLTSETKLCTAISVALHFVFLSSFTWMSIIAIDTWRAFTKIGHRTNRMTQREKRKRYLRSMAIGWVSPLIFCLFCFTLDATNTVTIGYGGTKGCWIQNSLSNLYFFAAPMGLLLLLNAVFFISTVKSINETMKNSQLATGQKRRKKDLGIFVRIAALMGFGWVFGFLSSLHLFLAYVFVINCTLQGVYIAVAFLFTKRILNLYSVLLSKGRSSSSTKTFSSSHQKGQKEQPLGSYFSQNSTNTKTHNLEDEREFQTESINTDDARL